MAKTTLTKKINLYGWLFVIPAALFIFVLNFYPMVSAFLLSLQTGRGNNLKFAGLKNYARLFQDEMFLTSVGNVITYLVIQVPVMLTLALILASILNDPKLKGKGIFRTLIFLPCATSLVSSAMIFKSFFSIDGIANTTLMGLGVLQSPMSWLTHPVWAKFVIILTITWRWTGYNTVFYLAGLQNIDRSVYEAARIDGASASRQFFSITIPLLKPVILLTTIMSTNGTLQLFDEVRNITNGGPGIATLSISQYIYNLSFMYNPQFGYAAAVSYAILVMVAVLSFIQIKVGDKR
ncbi:MAG: carbohydrate ABC transporter permease [Sphaerochaeta sp.]|uniref:carbohydrate ABC transporter permease n=1 Tax=unclassified Sphaerochaeta TaxID=2637943 RepID=UPI0025F1A49B|nr:MULTISPECIES: sugar ABC transporter permease [unclassified Sphaerochaeta]MCK9597736.1 sugar ABC transporter permease [Sphaerochaeta sp.]MDX9823818.1 sugar ABC transporter permease [Sphaerochaeta sp.]